jgi:hypothetical protein
MLVVGENLRALIQQHKIIESRDARFDDKSVSLRLDDIIISICPPEGTVLTYGSSIPPEYIREESIKQDQGFVPRQIAGDLFLFKGSTRQVRPYSGRYQGATKPTVQMPEK